MSKPASFKDLMKPKVEEAKSKIKTSFTRPLMSALTSDQLARMKELEREFVKFCNTLRCPLCSAQLDGGVSATSANLYCRANPEEYKANYFKNDPVFYKRVARLNFNAIQYRITTYHDSPDSKYKNYISKLDLSIAREDLREKAAVKMFEMEGSCLPLKFETNEKIFLEKVRTFIIFS